MKKFCTLLFISINITTLAQKQANIWYFGDYIGLDFNYLAPKVLTDGKITYDATLDAESSSVVSDENGNMLFYTDGVTIWNKNHEPMPNGTGLFGSSTTTQTLAVPQPGSTSLYYIFTASPQASEREICWYPFFFHVGFHYSMVDMTKENGLGDVVKKNILLSYSTTEKVAATNHRNKKDIWVVMHEVGNNAFRSYLITSNGLDEYPVISYAGGINDRENCDANSQGQLKFSPDGKKLAKAMRRNETVELFDFDNSNGRVKHWTTIENIPSPNGVEFSKKSKFLYVTGGGLHQFNLEDTNIQSSQFILNENEIPMLRAQQLQLAPDGKIYVAHEYEQYIGAINYPDSLGYSCHYETKQISLPLNFTCNYGLPNFLSSYFYDSTLYPVDTSIPNYLIEMPNMFTPNGDGLNDKFTPMKFYYIKQAMLKIINRWGGEVFYTSDVAKGWDGGDCLAGTYYWHVIFIGENGERGSQQGWVQLIR